MNRRIFSSMMLLCVIALFLVSSAVCLVFYGQLSETVRDELQARAELFGHTDAASAMEELLAFKPTDMRITLIDSGGAVTYDNTVDAQGLQNHFGREEVSEAHQLGVGESRRFSDTLGQETYYYAVRLTDGSILRVSKTVNSVIGMFAGALPAVVCVVLAVIFIGYLLAKNLTKRIVEPINRVDPDDVPSAPYDELAPFIKTIAGQRERIERQLSDLRSRTDTINAIMDNMSEGILLINRQGVIVSINKSASLLLDAGRPADGCNVLEVIRDLEFLGRVRGALSGDRGELLLERYGKTYRVFFSPVAGGGVIVLFLDITEKAMGEKMRREFSANVSHELKTPLTSIYGYAELLAGDMVKEPDKPGFYGKIKDEAARLITLIEDIILISRLDEGKGVEAFEETEIGAIAAEAIEALSLKAQEDRITVRVSGESAVIRADRSMIYEMFYNLIDNAIKYNKPGGSVEVGIARAGGRVLVSVADTGVGIPREDHARVFERFYRVDKSRSKKNGGTGLGLAIVRHIVMLHGGDVSLKSRENEGTVVTVSF